MKKIERRAVMCLLLALVLALGTVVFLGKYVLHAGNWASSAFNRHLYNSDGQLAVGTVLAKAKRLQFAQKPLSAPRWQ